MIYEEAIDILKRGGVVSRDGRVYVLRRWALDVTEKEPKRYYFSDEDRAAENWENATIPEPGVVAPETVDEILHEVPPEEEVVPATDDAI